MYLRIAFGLHCTCSTQHCVKFVSFIFVFVVVGEVAVDIAVKKVSFSITRIGGNVH